MIRGVRAALRKFGRHVGGASVTTEGDGYEKLLGVGLYTVSESVGVIRYRLGDSVDNRLLLRWAQGRKELARMYGSIISAPLKVEGEYLFTFSQLIELLTIAAFRSHGVKPRVIRQAYQRAKDKFGSHPFAREGYRTDGAYIYTSAIQAASEELSKQQMFFEEVVRPILMDVSYVDGNAAQFSPLGTQRSVVLDPKMSFGAPIDRKSGVSTSVLFAMRHSGESEESVADWYGVSIDAVQDAFEYESSVRKIAA